MLNQRNYINDDFMDLEDICFYYVEEELDIFFKSCLNAANMFAMKMANDLNSYSKETFETMVLSSEQIDDLIDKVNNRICQEIEMDGKSLDKLEHCAFDFSTEGRILARRINDYKRTLRITKISENVISNAFSYTLGNACSSNIVDYAVSKMKLGEKVLGDNSNKGQIERRNQEILNHLEGILINMKTKLKNDIIRQWLQYLYGDQQKLALVL